MVFAPLAMNPPKESSLRWRWLRCREQKGENLPQMALVAVNKGDNLPFESLCNCFEELCKPTTTTATKSGVPLPPPEGFPKRSLTARRLGG